MLHLRTSVLSAHHDGELSASAAARVDGHLRDCERCVSEYEELSSAANAVRHLRTMRAPRALASEIRDQIDAEERGMVPVLRSEIMRARQPSGFLTALGLGTLATTFLIGLVVLLDQQYGEQAARSLTTALLESTLPEPVLLHEVMRSPRFREGPVGHLAFAGVEFGKEGTLLTMASIDRNGMVQALDVIYRSGDEEMLTRTLEAVRSSGFEPARLGNETISVNFLYFFTTTEVRPGERLLSTITNGRRLSAANLCCSLLRTLA